MTRRTDVRAPDAFRILSPIHQANRQASLHIDAILSDLRVSASEGQLLAFVGARDGAPVTAVVRLLGVPKSTITSLLQRLERGGLIRRAPNPDDARSQLLFVTKKGAHLGMAARERVKELEDRLRARVSAGDLRALERIVDAVTAETGINLPAENIRRRTRVRRKK
jgi:DNA-binding MarR family transcriptional regulator